MSERCPFCRCNPFHYVDNGVGMEAVAITCCDLGIELYGRSRQASQFARRVLRNMRSHSPRRKARAMQVLRDYGVRA